MDAEPEDGGPAPPAPGRVSRPRALRLALAGWRTSGDPVPTTIRRAVRITLAACAGFYTCLYGFHQPVAATYALFSVVAMAGLSRIPGSGRQRAATIVTTLPLAWLLVTAGTLLAVRTWAAVAGMAVIGFALAFSAVTGPRLGGAVPGLQLLYILPCFPPFAPQILDERLAGTTLGIAALVTAEHFLLPDPGRPSFPQLLATAADAAGRCAGELAQAPWTLSGAARRQARAAAEALRPARIPEADRPAGPSARQRGLAHAGAASRELLARLQDLAVLREQPVALGTSTVPGPTLHPGALGQQLLEDVRAEAAAAASALRSGVAPPSPAALKESLRAFRNERAARCEAGGDGTSPAVLRRQAELIDAAEAALTTLRAVDVASRAAAPPDRHRTAGRPAHPERPAADGERALPDSTFWYARMSLPALLRHRLAGHLGRRSVYFQNAVRTSLGLALARTVAGVMSLPHGFWAMLAALTLTRTTALQTRTTVRQALTGTLLGAMAAAGFLVLVGRDSGVYAVALPVIMLATFCLGPTLGVGWAQALFTLTVSTVFAQLAPAGWHLAEARFLDVFTGSLIGLLCGLFAWPRGGLDELRRDTGSLLRTVAETLTSTVTALSGERDGPARRARRDQPIRHALVLMESSYAQAQNEPAVPWADHLDWQAAIIAGHHAVRGAERLLDHRGPPGTRLGPVASTRTTGFAEDVAARYLLLADELDDIGAGAPAGPPAPPARRPAERTVFADARSDTPPAALPLLFDTGAWLQGLDADLGRITPAPSRSAGVS
ncbi:FUSC family protein [Streptomyces sp. RKAG337]|uniref:FUSC family protein n=1 Tax=Streptomyces sp. RKAG337 TaxID=2893404 RepID=UPI00203454B6|nr:FUSC family protein [Streptomyces sp. RKAG337]MCM2424796.1 FUSC family protein [Streptomyces sp. RKAG337]